VNPTLPTAGRARVRREIVSGLVGLVLVVLALWLGRDVRSAEPTLDASQAGSLKAADALAGPGDVRAVTSYTLRASLDVDRHTIAGSGTITFVNISDKPLSALFVHLYLNAFEHERTVFRRERSLGFRGYDRVDEPGNIAVKVFRWREEGRELWPAGAHTPGDAEDRTDIEVPLPRAIGPGETATFEVEFESQLPSVALRTGFAGRFHMAAQWFPKLAKLEQDGTFAHFPFQRFSEFYADFGDYDVTLDVPDGFTVGATGRLTEERKEEGRHVRRYRQSAVHDFAFTAWDGFDERTEHIGELELRCLFPRGEERAAKIEMDAARRGLAFFGERYGAYPYETLTIVHPPEAADEAGGMEYPTLITTGGSHLDSFAPGRLLEGLTLHELGHQWFYGIIASNENASPLLDEGITSYITGEALVALYGEGGLIDVDPFPITVAAAERARQVGLYSHEAVAAAAGEFDAGSDYGGLVYGRSATIFRTLDGAFDGVFAAALSDFARAHRFGHPTPNDLVAAVRARGGEVPAAALSRAIFDRGWLDAKPLGISNRALADGKGYSSEVAIGRYGDIALPLVVELTDTQGRVFRETLPAGTGVFKLAVSGEAAITSVVVDPDRVILLDEDKRNDALGSRPSSFAIRTWLSTALVASALYQMASP
jgi:hypothetical protein